MWPLHRGCARLISWERSMSIEGSVRSSRKASRVTPEPGFLGLTCRASLIAVLAGAAGSLGLMLRAGRRQNSKILLLLFAIWVLSPFIALIGAQVVSKRWPILIRAALYSVMLVLTLASLACNPNSSVAASTERLPSGMRRRRSVLYSLLFPWRHGC